MSESGKPLKSLEEAELAGNHNPMLPLLNEGSEMVACTRGDRKAGAEGSVVVGLEVDSVVDDVRGTISDSQIETTIVEKKPDFLENAVAKDSYGAEVAHVSSGGINATAGVAGEETAVRMESDGLEAAPLSIADANATDVVDDEGATVRKESDSLEMLSGSHHDMNAFDSVDEVDNAAGKERNGSDMPSTSYERIKAIDDATKAIDHVVDKQIDFEEAIDGGAMVALPDKVPQKVSTLVVAAMKKYAAPRSSSYHGVTKLKWSGKFEAHLWDNTSRVEGRKRKGKHGMVIIVAKGRLDKMKEEAGRELSLGIYSTTMALKWHSVRLNKRVGNTAIKFNYEAFLFCWVHISDPIKSLYCFMFYFYGWRLCSHLYLPRLPAKQ
ncbi:AP2 [Musa troglodytarum]|uniref:AP2 n=1 Tax=Musa troglodytarum TaxID=320322 RepID=A0A9E7KCA2_9LILI|nr:AP2 [Musa troglodytarum]